MTRNKNGVMTPFFWVMTPFVFRVMETPGRDNHVIQDILVPWKECQGRLDTEQEFVLSRLFPRRD